MGAMVELDGEVRMESGSGAGPVLNPFIPVDQDLNMGDRDFGVGGALLYGDGFSGLALHFFRWEQKSFKSAGTLSADFGALLENDQVQSEVLLNQIRVNYIVPLIEDKKLTEATLRFGAGLGLHHNEFRLESMEINNARSQNLKFKDDFGVPMILLKGQVEYHPFRFTTDIGFSRGDFGGLNGSFLDLSFMAEYRVQRGIHAFVGYWRYDLPGEDVKNDLRFEFNMDLSGLFAGIRFEL